MQKKLLIQIKIIFFLKILPLVILISLSITQIINYLNSLKDIGHFNSTFDIKYKSNKPTIICINNKCLCRAGFK